MKYARPLSLASLCVALCFGGYGNCGGRVAVGDESWPGRRAAWNGYDQFCFSVAQRPCYVVVPMRQLVLLAVDLLFCAQSVGRNAIPSHCWLRLRGIIG